MSLSPELAAALSDHAAACVQLGCTPPGPNPLRVLSFPITLIAVCSLLAYTSVAGTIWNWIGKRGLRPWLESAALAAVFAVIWLGVIVTFNLAWGLKALVPEGPIISGPHASSGPSLGDNIEAAFARMVPILLVSALAIAVMRKLAHRLTVWGVASLVVSAFFLSTLNDYRSELRRTYGSPIPASVLANDLADMAQPYGVTRDQLRTEPFAIPGNGAMAFSLFTPRITFAYNLFSPAVVVTNGKHKVPRLTDRQIKAVTGHELAHIALNHSWKRLGLELGLGALLIGLAAAGTAWMAQRHGARWRVKGLADPAMLPAYLSAYVAANLILGFTLNAQSRAHEYETDELGLTISGDRDGFATALIRINSGYDLNYSSTLAEWLATHPSPQERIDAILKLEPNNSEPKRPGEETAVGQ